MSPKSKKTKIKKQTPSHPNKRSVSRSSRERTASPAEIGVGLMLTGLLVYLHVTFYLHAGGLWRDEVNSVEIAKLPGVRDIWGNLEYDSFPILWHLLLRMWFALGLGGSDGTIRIWGLVVGIGIIGALWWNARRFHYRVPLMALALIGFNATVLTGGDTIRAYGLGALSGLLAISAIWQAAVKGRFRDWIVASIISLIAVHLLFHNAVLIFSACVAGAVLCWRMRLSKRLAAILGIGAISAVSLWIYVGTIESAKRWIMILRYPVDFAWLWLKFRESLTSTAVWMPKLWIGLVLTAALIPCILLLKKITLDEPRQRAVLFAGTLLGAGIMGYLVFLKVLSYLMQPWYFIVLIVIVGSSIDTIFAMALVGRRMHWLRILLALAITMSVFANIRQAAMERRTNVDLIAEILEKEARAGDTIVLGRWYYGIPFQRYYHGNVQWVTIPPVAEHRFHKWDQLKEQMQSQGVMTPVLSPIEKSLRAGHQVWVVGEMIMPREGEALPKDAPRPDEGGGWREMPYYDLWSKQMWSFLMSHAEKGREETPKNHDPVFISERLNLFLLNGWKD
jgi:hypothetical protein